MIFNHIEAAHTAAAAADRDADAAGHAMYTEECIGKHLPVSTIGSC